MRKVVGLGMALWLAPQALAAGPDQPSLPPSAMCGPTAEAAPAKPATELLSGYGTGGFPILTKNPKAQAFFDNGLQLGHAFAHKPSIAAFQEAVKVDPSCAMCVWGEAWSRGPTINYPIDDAKEQKALAALADRAAALGGGESARNRRLIAALQTRYRSGGGKGAGDDAFARAMDALARAYPEDNEIAVLAADAWMIPAAHRRSRKNMPRAVEILEAALKRNPDDTGAIHFYIHATEISGFGGRALPYAERLQALSPAASHLVHMPSHTYYLVGRYAEALRSNQDATQLDQANARRQGLAGPDGVWKLSYHGHNVQFGIGSALMDGDGQAALALSGDVIRRVPQIKPDQAFPQIMAGTAYFAQGRYADPAAVAALPDPGAQLPYVRAMWRYARGEAAARRGDAKAVRAEAAEIRLAGGELKPFAEFRPQALAMVEVARLVLQGRAAMLERDAAGAAEAYGKAATIQESKLGRLRDPPAWWYPVRRSHAAALLEAGQPARAAAEAQASLARWPNDPLALLVLSRAEQAQGRVAQADQRLAEARRGWTGDLGSMRAGLL